MTLVSNSIRRKKLKQAKKKVLAPKASPEEERVLLLTKTPLEPLPPVFAEFKEGDICSFLTNMDTPLLTLELSLEQILSMTISLSMKMGCKGHCQNRGKNQIQL